MAAPDCVFYRTLCRSRQNEWSCPAVCRERLHVVDLQRYSRDLGSSVYFPQAVLNGDDLYDATLTDGHCRLRVTLDPGLNRLVERYVLRSGSTLRDAAFTPAMTAQLPACPMAPAQGGSYRLLSAQVSGGGLGSLHVDSLSWFGSSGSAGALVPLRANRSVFLPLWNNVDYSGEAWREAPPAEEEEEEEEEDREVKQIKRPAVTVSELRDSFLIGRGGVARGVVHHQLIVRIINKSHLMYYGRRDLNCECPYKAVLEVCDRTGSVCVVLWNSVCLGWYRRLKPGDVITLRRYRVKRRFQAQPDDIEVSVNSRNPAALISVLPESSASTQHLPPAAFYSFCNRYTHSHNNTHTHTHTHTYSVSVSKELLDRPHGAVCDVIGLLTFSGRHERIGSDGRGAELLEYHWLRLEDGSSNQPIMVKLFSTSQPESHHKLHPLSVVVCTRLKLVRAADGSDVVFYLTNTTYTQVYCTGMRHHSEMSYRKLRPVRQFLQWLRSQEDGEVLRRALIGGFFIYPPPPVSLEMYMKDRRGAPGLLRGAELQRELERLRYRERQTFCIQAAVTMVMYSRRGEEQRCLCWTDRASSLCSSPCFRNSSPFPSPSPVTPRSVRSPPSSSSPSSSPASLCSTSTPVDHRSGKSRKRRFTETLPRKRRPFVTLQPEQSKSVILFEASMEFLQSTNADEDNEEDEDGDTSAPPPLEQPRITWETLPLRYDHAHREEQAVAVAMGGALTGRFDSVLDEYYTLRLRALSDGVLVDALFLPLSSSSLPHANTWTSILSHGAFCPHTAAPSPADLINMATQLANQRLVCVLEACHLGGATTEIVLSRAFPLNH